MSGAKRKSAMKQWLQLAALVVVIALPLAAFYFNNLPPAPQQQTPPSAQATPAEAAAQQSAPAVLLVGQAALPEKVAAAQIVPFEFSVENPGGVPANYQYKVSVQWKSGETDVLDENVLSVPAYTSVDVPEAVKFETAGAVGTITISVQDAPPVVFVLPTKN